MSEESPHVGEWVHFTGMTPTPDGRAVPVCLPALVLAVLPAEAVKGSDGLPVIDPVLLEIHQPDGIRYPQPVARGLTDQQPGCWHPRHAPGKITLAQAHSHVGRFNGGKITP